MASNASKLWNTVKNTANKYMDWSAQHPVISSTVSGLAAPYTGITLPALTAAAQFKDPNKAKQAKPAVSYNPVSDVIGTYGDYSESYGGSGGSGGYSSGGYGISSIVKPDISGLLTAYDQQAESAKKTAQSSYDTTRNDLLTSLKRFQEQNAKDVANQKSSYLSEQSSLEAAREQANRQNRIAASARGLGGSGLQQLAQLQTLLAQGEDISDAAKSNQDAMDALRLALQQREDDTNSNLQKAQTTLDNALNSIDSNLAQQKAQAIYEVEKDYANTINSLLGRGGSGGYSSGGYGNTDAFDALLETGLSNLNAELQNYAGMNYTQLKDSIEKNYGVRPTSMNQVRTILANNAMNNIAYDGMSSAAYNNAKTRATNMVNSLKGYSTKKKK